MATAQGSEHVAEHALLAPHQIILRPLVTEKGMHRSTRHKPIRSR